MRKTKRIRISTICFAALVAANCGANEGVLRSGNETPVQANAVDDKPSFEKDMNALHTAGFTYIYELRRRDGEAIDSEEVSIIRELTVDTNRRIKSDSNKAVLIGSNFELSNDDLSALNARFLVVDHSATPGADVKTDANFNK